MSLGQSTVSTLLHPQLTAFYTCAQEQSFTRAAKLLHLTQSALSQRIKNLESDLELTLFIRDPQGIRLTEAGEELLRYCHTQRSLGEETLSRLKGAGEKTVSGEIRIAGYSSVMRSVVLQTLAPLLRKHPELKLKMMSAELNELPGLLDRSEVDFILLDHFLERDSVESVLLGQERLVLVESKKHESRSFLDHDSDDETTKRYLKKHGARAEKKLERRYLDDIYGILDGVSLGLGRAVVPLHLIENRTDLKVISPHTHLETPVVLHFFKQAFYPQVQKMIVEELKEKAGGFLKR